MTDDDEYVPETEGTCCLCGDPIDVGYLIRDDAGFFYDEGCWAP